MTKGSYTRLTKIGRVMHCGICRQRGHKRGACPNKPADYIEKLTKKMAPKRKTFNTKEAELVEEMERAQQEVETGEKQLMEELLFNETDMIAPSPTTLVFVSFRDLFQLIVLCISIIKYF